MTGPTGLRSSPDARPAVPLDDLLTAESVVYDLARDLADALPGTPVTAGVSPSIRPALIAALFGPDSPLTGRAALAVLPDDRSARTFTTLVRPFIGGRPVHLYPSRGTGYDSQVSPPPHLTGMRIEAIDALSAGREGESSPLVVASAVALAEAVPDASLRPSGFPIRVGDSLDLAEVADRLSAAGYERVEQVVERGQFAVRGGILDLFTATAGRPARLEMFGDEVETIREFSTFTQRSTGELEEVAVTPAAELDADHRELAEMAIAEAAESGTPVRIEEMLPTEAFRAPLDLVSDEIALLLVGVEEIEPALEDHWEDVTTALHADDARHLYLDVAEPLAERAVLAIARPTDGEQDDRPAAIRASFAESPARNASEAEAELERLVTAGYRVVVTFETAGEAERTRFAFDRLRVELDPVDGPSPSPGVTLLESRLPEGFVWPAGRVAVYPWRRLVNRARKAEAPGPSALGLSAAGLRVGDYVVHENHGIARFAGFETREVAGTTRDYLLLEYAGDDRVYAPTDQLEVLSRYAGGLESPTLSALGGKKWQNLKARARKAAAEMAGELVNLYAERRARKGHPFAPDSEWVVALEQSFPHRETADQIQAIEAVKADMEAERPMDRLVCGDVGYGKTEVALRAAAKAASDGKQVVLLAPTTILAQQHLGTFTERFRDLPFTVEGVSRLTSAAESRRILADWSSGRIDVLIGTHRLLSRDVRAHDLGLVILDEEQRFGVKQKELLRQMKMKVDVLSMSATPIPRTLQMSMSGLRDISVIETPPEGRRPVRTYVGPWDEELVSQAIRREVGRGGQVFYLHNRVETLERAAEMLRAIAPGVRVTVAHGQMSEGELEQAMLTFLRGDSDLLVATTIIESGIDIPAANTLIVERSDLLGLAQAYQIRGRVGRSRERAYAYLMYPSEEALTEEASSRLATLADHTELGSGFRIAMRDLDIRGAGNLLGDEQSGHVAAVGFELYCQLIDEAVAGLTGPEGEAERPDPVRLDLALDAYLPADYIPYEAAKIDLHRRIAAARRPGDLRAIEAEMVDRFGPLPEEAANLLRIQRVRVELATAGVESIQDSGSRIVLTGLSLEPEQASDLAERLGGSAYDFRKAELSLVAGEQADERLGRLEEAADALVESGMGMLPKQAETPREGESGE
jgi:transcription-repair coupling factor (superfamily II helicase)